MEVYFTLMQSISKPDCSSRFNCILETTNDQDMEQNPQHSRDAATNLPVVLHALELAAHHLQGLLEVAALGGPVLVGLVLGGCCGCSVIVTLFQTPLQIEDLPSELCDNRRIGAGIVALPLDARHLLRCKFCFRT